MRKQLIILFAVLLAVFLAIGCTSDTQDQPTENQTTVDQPTTEPTTEPTTTEDMDTEEDMTESDTVEEEDMTENDTMEEEDMTENDTMEDEEMDNETMDGGETLVTIDENGFAPAEIEVSVGETVTWTNQDNTVHSVMADDASFDSGELDGGESFSYTFEEEGTYDYGSDEDPFFDGTVTVTSEDGTTENETTVTNGNVVVPAD